MLRGGHRLIFCYFGTYNTESQRNRIIKKGLEKRGIKIVECRTNYTNIIRVYIELFFKSLLILKKVDLIIVGENGYVLMPLARFLGWIYRKRVVLDAFFPFFDSLVYDRKIIKPNSFRAKKLLFIDWLGCFLADLIITDTNSHKEFFITKFKIPGKKILTIYVGADDSIFFPREEEKENQFFKVLFFGSYIPLHGVKYILEAAKLLEDYKDIKFYLIGKGQTYLDDLEFASKLQLHNVEFIDSVDELVLPLEIVKYDVCLGIFGDTEKTKRVIPFKVFISISMRKPVITADTPAIREIFEDGENVRLCKVADAESLAEKIIELKNDPKLREKISEKGYQLYKNNFTPELIISPFLNEIHKKGILYIAASGEIMGGGQVSLYNLLKHIDRGRFNPMVICPSSGEFFDQLKEADISCSIIKTGSLRRFNVLRFLSSVIKLSLLIKREKISLIHCDAAASRETFYSGIVAQILRIPFIWHVRVAESAGWIDKLLSAMAKKIIVNSNAVGRRFPWIDKPYSKVIAIYNGVNLAEFSSRVNVNKIRDEFAISERDTLVGVVGQLIPWKGHMYFLESAKEVAERISSAKFMIVGDEIPKGSGYRKKLEEFTFELGIRDKVIFTGFRKDIPDILSAFDIFVLPSLGEPFGRVIIEAMAMAKPVIATNAGGVPEIIVDGKTGILVPPEDPRAMTEAIIELLKDRDKAKKLGENGRKRVEEVFTIQEHVIKVQQLYLELLK